MAKISKKNSLKLARPLKKAVKKLAKKVGQAPAIKKSRNRALFSTQRAEIASQKIAIVKNKDKSINVNIVDNPLDVYQSPHLLDLSRIRYIEKVKPSLAGGDFSYENLPGGEWLSKLYIFELLSFEQSEILNALKKFFARLGAVLARPFQTVDFSAKLPLMKNSQSLSGRFSVWREVTLINLFVSIFSGLAHWGENCQRLWAYIFGRFRANLINDEVVDFHLRPIGEPTLAPALAAAELSVSILPITKPQKKNSKIKLENHWVIAIKGTVAFAVMAALVILPIWGVNYWQKVKTAKGQVLGEAEQAMSNLQVAQSQLISFNLGSAENAFSAASQHFISAQNQLREVKSFLTVLAEISPINNSFRSGKNLLALGGHLANAGQSLLSGINSLMGQNDQALTDKIKKFKINDAAALAELKLAQENLNKINLKHLPVENRSLFGQLKNKLPALIAGLEKTDGLINFAVNFLADGGIKRYLVVFQNDNELRATGGFMGSFALVDLVDGKIKNITIPPGGTYDVRAGFHELIASPQPMQLLNPRWEFQDANWWPDWPTSAKSIEWFYNKSGGPTVDGVIAINSGWLEKLLAVVGPIDLPDYGQTITAANFETEIQKEVEINRQDAVKPKKILADLAPKLLDKIFNVKPENALALIAAINSGLNEKGILVYLSDPQLENFVVNNNWDGGLADTNSDYLNVVATNIGGGKTDSAVKQKIYHQAQIAADGSIIDQVLISRYNFGPVDENFTNQANRSYLRVYVPAGSELLAARGFVQPLASEFRVPDNYLQSDARLAAENQAAIDPASQTKIYNESGKTVFANWLTLNPGQARDLLLVYKLPFKVNLSAGQGASVINKIKAAFTQEENHSDYGLYWQKQPGSGNDEITSEVIYPDHLKLNAIYPPAAKSGSGAVMFNGQLTNDQCFLTEFMK